MPAKLLKLWGFAGIRICDEPRRAPVSSSGKSVILTNSEGVTSQSTSQNQSVPHCGILAAYGISKRALQEWEQGGRQPDSAARAYLTVIEKEPAMVRRALGKE